MIACLIDTKGEAVVLVVGGSWGSVRTAHEVCGQWNASYVSIT